MIKIENLSKNYDGETILEQVNISISSPCFIAFCGASGCGKSTLLNIISMMDTKYEGEYLFNGMNVKKLSNQEKESLITNYLTYLFQEPKFIEEEDVKTNLSLMSNIEVDTITIDKYLKEFNLDINLDLPIKLLSKGERKRIYLIGALLRNNNILICDEITSGLDEKNSKEVLNLLKRISQEKIVIIVSHDVEILKLYCDNIYYFQNHKIPKVKVGGIKKFKINNYQKNNKLKISYLFAHATKLIFHKKYRTLILVISQILCLFTMGLSLLISDTMKSNLSDSFTSYFNSNLILMENKDKNATIQNKVVVDANEFIDFENQFNDLTINQKAIYLANFENMFNDENYLVLKINGTNYTLDGYGVSSINQVVNTTMVDKKFLPQIDHELRFDEIILTLNDNQIFQICSLLRLNSYFASDLEKYLFNNHLNSILYIANSSWEYYLEIPFKIVSFVLGDQPTIYHTNFNFNKVIIEDTMQLPYSYNLNEIDYYPWTIKKLDCIIVENVNLEELFKRTYYDSKLNKLVFNLVNKKEYTFYYDQVIDYSLVYFTYASKNNLFYAQVEEFISQEENIEGFIPCNQSSFYVDDTSLFNGFYSPTYFSSDLSINHEFIDYNSFSNVNLGGYQSSVLQSEKNNFYTMSLLDCTKNNYVKFTPYFKRNLQLKEGEYPSSSEEIIVSNKLSKEMKVKIGDLIYLTMLEEVVQENERYKNIFATKSFKISGISYEEENKIYQENLFPLIITNLYFNLNNSNQEIDKCLLFLENNSTEYLEKINQNVDYYFYNPLDNYLNQIENTLDYVSIGLMIFSLITFISSFSMLVLVNYLFIKEGEREIAIYRFLGYRKKSIFFLFILLLGVVCFLSFIFTILMLLFTSLLIPFIEPVINTLRLSFLPFFLIILVISMSFLFAILLLLPYYKNIDVIKLIKK